MILEMHHAVEGDLSTLWKGERTGLAGLERMMAGEMPPQRKFVAQVPESVVQWHGGVAEAMKVLIGFASQREEVADRRLRLE